MQASDLAVVPSQRHIAETDIAVSRLRVVLQLLRPQSAVSINRATGKQFLVNSIRAHNKRPFDSAIRPRRNYSKSPPFNR